MSCQFFLAREPRRFRNSRRKRLYDELFSSEESPASKRRAQEELNQHHNVPCENSLKLLELPNEVLGHVFGFLSLVDLSKTQLVCLRWRWLVQNYGWRAMRVISYSTLQGFTDVKPAIKFAEPELRFLLNKCGKYIRGLDMHELRWGFTDPRWTFSIAPLAPKLKALNLSGIHLSVRALGTIGENCPLLEDVNFNSSLLRPGFEDALQKFFERCQFLKNIDLGGNWFLDGNKSFRSLPPLVEYLNIDYVQLLDKPMECIRERCPNLTTFVLNNFMVESMDHLNRFFLTMKKLSRLSIDCLADPQFRVGRVKPELLKNITEMTITNAPLYTEPMLRLGARFTNLRYLDLRERTEELSGNGLVALSELPCLTCLSLSDLRWLHDEVIAEISRRGILKVLLLHCCIGLTDRGVVSVLRTCKDLVCLDLSGCILLTNDIIDPLKEFVKERENREKKQRLLDDTVARLVEDLSIIRLPRRRRDAMVGPRKEWNISECVALCADSGWKKTPFEDFRNRMVDEVQQWQKKGKPEGEKRKTFSELHVWVGNSDVDPFYQPRHQFLRMYDNHPLNRPYFRLGVKEIR